MNALHICESIHHKCKDILFNSVYRNASRVFRAKCGGERGVNQGRVCIGGHKMDNKASEDNNCTDKLLQTNTMCRK